MEKKMLKITTPELLNNLPDENTFIGTLPKMTNSSINFNGNNNIFYCDNNVHLVNSVITFNGSNSVVYLCRNKHAYKLDVVTYNNSAFYVGKDNYFNNKLSAILSEQKHIFIGNDCLFSLGIWMRIADPHLIYDISSKKRLNITKSIYLGDHVWIGQSALILKGTQIHSGSIIGAMSVVSGKKIESNTSWAGNPVKQIAENIFWTGKCVHSWTDNDTAKNEICDTDAYIYQYTKEEYLSFDNIDDILTSASTAQERYTYLNFLTKHFNKNRFSFSDKEKAQNGLLNRFTHFIK